MRHPEPSTKDDYSDMEPALDCCIVPAKVDLVVDSIGGILLECSAAKCCAMPS